MEEVDPDIPDTAAGSEGSIRGAGMPATAISDQIIFFTSTPAPGITSAAPAPEVQLKRLPRALLKRVGPWGGGIAM